MPYRIVQSKQNSRLKQLRTALAHPLRDRGATGTVLAGIEGPNLLEEAVKAGLRIHCVFVAEGAEWLAEPILGRSSLPAEPELLMVPKDLLNSALTTEAPQPIAALVEPTPWTWAHVFEERRKSSTLLLVLAGLQDPGNLGTILRSAEAFGANGVISLPGTVNAWNPKAVRASAGSLFRLPLLSVTSEDCFRRLRESGVKLWTTTVHAAEPADRVDLTASVAFLIGNEGSGVPDQLAAQAGGALTIPCPGPVESLNASVAASVLLYEAARQRSSPAAAHPNRSQNAAKMLRGAKA